MYRSFHDRILAGVCGGIAETIRLPSSLLRLLFVVLTVLSLGFGALAYLALWWVMPQRLPMLRQRGNIIDFLFVIVVIVAMTVLWVGREAVWLSAPTGQSLFVPLVILMLGVTFLLRQVRGVG
jgi:phage shock protein PspC (stress-responsive transcriptional regulator)